MALFAVIVVWPAAIMAACGLESQGLDGDAPRAAAPTGSVLRGGFSRHLRQAGDSELWIEDLLARWRDLDRTPAGADADERPSDRATRTRGRLEIAWEISRWLDAELGVRGLSEIQDRFPALWVGEHAAAAEFASVRLVMLQPALTDLGAWAMSRGLQENAQRETPSEAARDLQRQLRLLGEQLGAVAGALAEFGDTMESQRLRQLQSVAEANLAWAIYYEWLVRPWDPIAAEQSLRAAGELFMRQLGVTEPDLQSTDSFRWFSPRQPSAVDHLLGLGLCSAAQGRATLANTCFATLRQHADRDLAERILLWQLHNDLKRQRWDEAHLLLVAHLQNSRSVDSRAATRCVDVLLSWFHDPAAVGDHGAEPTRERVDATAVAGAVTPPDGYTVWAWRMLELLVRRGQIDEASQLRAKYQVRLPETGLATQVLRLNEWLTSASYHGPLAEQGNTLVEALTRWADPNGNASVDGPRIPAAIQSWAKLQLSEIKLRMGDRASAVRILQQLYAETPLENQDQRQSIAWRIAQWSEADRDRDAATRSASLEWYRRAAEMPGLPLTAAAEIKVQLEGLADRPMAQEAYLRSVPQTSPGYDFAQRQRLSRLHERVLTESPGSLRQRDLMVELQSVVVQLLALPEPPPASDGTAWVAWQADFRQYLTRAQQSEHGSSTIAFLQVWLQALEAHPDQDWKLIRGRLVSEIVEQALESPPRFGSPWSPLVVLALAQWAASDIAEIEATRRLALVESLLQNPLLPSQAHGVMAKTVPVFHDEWEQANQAGTATVEGDPKWQSDEPTQRLTRLYRQWWAILQNSPEVDEPSRWTPLVAVRFSDLLWRQAVYQEAAEVLAACPAPPEPRRFQLQMARVQSSMARGAGLEHWEHVAEGFPSGSREWFEAKWHLLEELAQREPMTARIQYLQIRQLYPQIPEPWSDHWVELGSRHGW